jgi:cbb3-type cytochrome c oxidase subunit III
VRRVLPLIGVAALLAGCGTGGRASSHADTAAGQKLFTANCGACHTLAAAGTSGTVGPNLDDAFAGDRAQGFKQSSIQNVVLDQIRLGSGPVSGSSSTQEGTPMPSNIVTGQDAQDVAAYVASVAGQGGAAASPSSLGTNGKTIFTTECAGCHTLKAAGTTGTIGPNLDQIAARLTQAHVEHQVTFGGAIMPPFKGKLSPAQITAVAKYVSSVAGK